VAKALAAVVGDHPQLLTAKPEAGKIIHFGIANGRIQTAFAHAGSVNIPYANAVFKQKFATFFIAIYAYSKRAEWQNRFKYPPELVLWMGVILLACKRRRTWETAQHQQASVIRDQRRQAG